MSKDSSLRNEMIIANMITMLDAYGLCVTSNIVSEVQARLKGWYLLHE
jgi:hypothetical protein